MTLKTASLEAFLEQLVPPLACIFHAGDASEKIIHLPTREAVKPDLFEESPSGWIFQQVNESTLRAISFTVQSATSIQYSDQIVSQKRFLHPSLSTRLPRFPMFVDTDSE